MKIYEPDYDFGDDWYVVITFDSKEEAFKWYNEQKINKEVDDELKEYEGSN